MLRGRGKVLAGAMLVLGAGGVAARADQPAEVVRVNGRPVAMHGVLGRGRTTDEAVGRFVREQARALGLERLEVGAPAVMRSTDGRRSIVRLEQFIDGVPVERGGLNLLVMHAGLGEERVVYAGARLAPRPAGGFVPDRVGAARALAGVRADRRFAGLREWTAATLVIFNGEGDLPAPVPAVRTWKFSGRDADPAAPRAYTFFVSAADGALLFVRDEILKLDVTGQVIGLATPGNAAAGPGNPPVASPLADVLVRVAGGSAAYSDVGGNFVIPHVGEDPVQVEVALGAADAGRWARVNNAAGDEVVLAQLVTPGAGAVLNVHPAETETTLAQVNAYVAQTAAHNFFRERAPGFAGLDTVVTANVMLTPPCDAFYDGVVRETNFFAAGEVCPDGNCVTCANTAFSNAVNHEYGHHIVNRLFLAQGAFGEGFADCVAMLIHDDPIVGRGFYPQTGQVVRDPVAANQQFPCGATSIHTCGMILSGVVWSMREALGATYGSEAGLEVVRRMFVDWALLTRGGQGLNSAHAVTLREFLAIDDDDGLLCNGTPHWDQIVPAFLSHGITDVPAADRRVRVTLEDPRPDILMPEAPAPVAVVVEPGTATVGAGGVVLLTRVGGGEFAPSPMTDSGGGRFEGFLPPLACGTSVDYRFDVQTTDGVLAYPTLGCQGMDAFRAAAAASTVQFTDDFESGNIGWSETLDELGGAATPAGRWELADPVGTGPATALVAPEDDATADPGSSCWITTQQPDGATGVGAADIDNARVTLTSPVFDVGAAFETRIAYARWFNNSGGANVAQDPFLVQASTDGGATWADFETVGPDGPEVLGGWIRVERRLDEAGIASGGQVRLRFIAEDDGASSIVEAGVDDLRVTGLHCAPCNDLDFNNDGESPSESDLLDLLTVFGGGDCPTADCDSIDFNNDLVYPDTEDLLAFLRVIAGGPCRP